MHYVGRVDWAFADAAAPDTAAAAGLARKGLVGPAQGAIHTELAAGALVPGGWIARHLHSFEEALYILDGELLLQLEDRVHRLRRGDYALIPIGVRHALANTGPSTVRWLSVNTPQRLGSDAGRRDTFYAAGPIDLGSFSERAERPPFGDPTVRWVGHYDGTPPQLEALRVDDPARGRSAAGMDSALLVYSGISVKMLIDRGFGADLLTMFTVDYEIGGAAQAHDHPFEETYFFLAGEIEAELDGTTYQLRAGDVVFAGVGSVHGFYNVGTQRVRWIETQAPQPPARHSYRWIASWKRFETDEAI